MDFLNGWRRRAGEMRSLTADRLRISITKTATSVGAATGEAYTTALNWKNNGELSNWLSDHFSSQYATIASKAMDAEYLRSHLGGSWHRLYDGGHTLAGSWNAVAESLPDADSLDKLSTWANEYWKDLITTRGMPVVLLDHADKVSEYVKHLDCINVAELVGGDLCGVSIYCNWNDPTKLVASATAMECSGFAYANIVSPLVSLIALGRACFLLKRNEHEALQSLISPALKGLSRSGSSILLISVLPGGFLLHLSCGIVVSLAHTYAWEKASENKEAIFEILLKRLKASREDLQAVPNLSFVSLDSLPPSTT